MFRFGKQILHTNRIAQARLCTQKQQVFLFSSLSQSTIDIVKSTAPVLAEHGYTITTVFYKKMLSENAEVRALFNPSHQIVLPGEDKARQPWSLASAVHAYAANIDNLGALSEAVERIAHKHVSLYILPEHYSIVGENLLWGIKEVLGDAATPEIINAWAEAYGFLANIFIEREKELRNKMAAAEGGWEGWRKFSIVDKVKESSEITSFYLKPVDGGALPQHQAGQYIGIRVEEADFITQRNYTLSSSPNQSLFRISVKEQPALAKGAPAGKISKYLHDAAVGTVVQLGVPSGDFFLEIKDDKPIVLLSGGVGITPIISMLEHCVNTGVKNKIFVVTCSRSPQVEAMHEQLAKYRRSHPNIFVKTLYDEKTEDYLQGPISESILDQIILNRDANYYFCGTTGFMKAILGILSSWKVPEEQVHFEFFGPHTDLQN